MCLILFAFQTHPHYPLIVAANRDEFYNRPAAPADFWNGAHTLAGRDLVSDGTWLGVTRGGRFAALTNRRDFHNRRTSPKSRGLLVPRLLHATAPEQEMRTIAGDRQTLDYNLLAGGPDHLFFLHSESGVIQPVLPGVHALSNATLDTPWPKVMRGRERLAQLVIEDRCTEAELFTLLEERDQAPDDHLPDTGIGLEWERSLSPLHIDTPDYGTRCATLLWFHEDGSIRFVERTYRPGFDPTDRSFTIKAGDKGV